jgi:hypothetical protein
MSLEFGIEFSCAARRCMGEQRLRELSRVANLNSRFITLNINSTTRPTNEMVEFFNKTATQMQEIEKILPLCRQCPANLDREFVDNDEEKIGCLGRINYPIDSLFEKFLANRIQLITDTVSTDQWPRIVHVLLDVESPFDGEATKELRRITTAEGLRFFELHLPIRLHNRASRLTTNNVFDLLGGFASTDEGSSSYCRELPVVALADYTEFFDAIFSPELLANENKFLISKSRSFRQFLRYVEAVKRADELQARILID